MFVLLSANFVQQDTRSSSQAAAGRLVICSDNCSSNADGSYNFCYNQCRPNDPGFSEPVGCRFPGGFVVGKKEQDPKCESFVPPPKGNEPTPTGFLYPSPSPSRMPTPTPLNLKTYACNQTCKTALGGGYNPCYRECILENNGVSRKSREVGCERVGNSVSWQYRNTMDDPSCLKVGVQSTNMSFAQIIAQWVKNEITDRVMNLFVSTVRRVPGLQKDTCDPNLPAEDPLSCKHIPTQ